MLNDATTLITSIMSSVDKLFTDYKPSGEVTTHRLFEADGAGLSVARSHIEDDRCRFLAGDVRDGKRLHCEIADVLMLIHAAAMKHGEIVNVTP